MTHVPAEIIECYQSNLTRLRKEQAAWDAGGHTTERRNIINGLRHITDSMRERYGAALTGQRGGEAA